jgi:hypothetical protein
MMIGNLGQGIEPVHRGKNGTPFLGQQRLGRTPNRLAVINNKYFKPLQIGC